MPLTVADFDDFTRDSAQRFLNGFDRRTQRRGEEYFRDGAVEALDCAEPGREYSADVQGSQLYSVGLFREDGHWNSECSCPVEFGCKHAYAAMKQLLAEYAGTAKMGASAKPANAAARAKAESHSEFGQTVLAKLGRAPTSEEVRYLKAVARLYKKLLRDRFIYEQDLAPFVPTITRLNWHCSLHLAETLARTEAEFWNQLAFYLVEGRKLMIPELLRPFTDFAALREKKRKAERAAEINRWSQALGQLEFRAARATQPQRAEAAPLELRVRFLRDRLVFETRAAPDDAWQPVKATQLRDFDQRFAPRLAAESALLWLPFAQRARLGYSVSLTYNDPETTAQAGRWFRQPQLRASLADENGAPLVFHDAPLKWNVTQPESDDGDYVFSLVQSNGGKVPEVRMVADVGTAFYLTSVGVFTGPPIEASVIFNDNETRIPAQALESAGGMRLVDRLQAATPPRLAALVRTVKLLPRVRAELKSTWPGAPESCCVQVRAVSEDGDFSERWTPGEWMQDDRSRARTKSKRDQLLHFDRADADGLPGAVAGAGCKWDFHLQCWTLKLSKRFAETFVTFLKALPPQTQIDLRGELATFQNAEVAGRIRLEALESETDWFDLRVLVDVNDATLTPEEIKLLLDAKGGWVRLDKKGWRKLEFKLSEEEDKELARLGLTPHELTSEPQRLHALQLADQAARKFLPEDTCERIERRAAELQARVTPEVPATITAELRPYQRDGFHFLTYLSTNRFGGILADDMGLGKTLQTLAWIEWLKEGRSAEGRARNDAASGDRAAGTEHGTRNTPPSLVVCPKSVADNWCAEAQRFLPTLRVKAWSASDLKNLPGSLAEAGLHVINYNQLRLVGDALARAKFLAVVLDEGQYIKNPSSLTGQMARKLRAEHRLILSGTPIENRLLDLWSLMSFAMPGALGSRAEFGRLYDAKGDPFARQRLSARVRPFLIRRTKAQVARDLPDRIEEDLFCELEGEQKTLYRAELKRAQAMLLGIKTAAALNKQRFNFLTSLLRLRQICCHPKLVKPDSKAASAKIEALIETLEPLMEEGQKVLVFSQFVEMLDLIRSELKGREWKHWYLAGDTENRGDLVRKFQSAEGGGVFLISLKAGGFGLNLTASSYVILFDPWWNPAVENQAIDRTHRIGQTQKVIAYRLLIKDSIEEKIRALQRQKKGLAEDVLGEEKFSQSLSLDDLRYLLGE